MALVILNRSKQTFGRVLNRLTKTRRVEEPSSSFTPRSLELYRGERIIAKKNLGDREGDGDRRAIWSNGSHMNETFTCVKKNAFF